MRKTLIFGNGLGMSIDPYSYSLTSAMNVAWDDPTLDAQHKTLVAACLPNGSARPTSEDQLGTLQETVAACETLLNVRKSGGDHWLTPMGQGFPEAVYRFSFLVARQMYLAEHSGGGDQGKTCALPAEFMDPLAVFIRENSSHVATLNYDGLLSKALTDRAILDCERALLLDGFVSEKFDRSNLFRKKGIGGWYLHLHGSPLFAHREKSKPYKLAPATLKSSKKVVRNSGKHIVLTHFKHKPTLIEASEVLRTYWEFLDLAIEESSALVLFGYSGNDLHLNRLISQARGDKEVTVVEWLGCGTKTARKSFWSEQLGGAVELRLLEDILTFSDW